MHDFNALLQKMILSYRLIFALIFFCFVSKFGFTEQTAKLIPNPTAEVWVQKQIEKGLQADLKILFPEEKDRVLSGLFIAKLLIGKPAYESLFHPKIEIKNAIISDPLYFEFTDFSQITNPFKSNPT